MCDGNVSPPLKVKELALESDYYQLEMKKVQMQWASVK